MHYRSYVIAVNDTGGDSIDVIVSVCPRNAKPVTGGYYGLNYANSAIVVSLIGTMVRSIGRTTMPRAFLRHLSGYSDQFPEATWAP